MPRILVADPLTDTGIKILKEAGFNVDVRPDISADDLLNVIGNYDGLIVRSRTKVGRQVVEAARKLKAVGRAGVGLDNIDLAAAKERGIEVFNSPTGNVVAAAEHTIALLFALARDIPRADALMKQGVWAKKELKGVQVAGKTLGLVGMGNVGSQVANMALGIGMKVIAYDPYLPQTHPMIKRVPLKELADVLKEADFISIHTPLTESTRNLIGKKELSLMKKGARLINCARGGIVNETALVEALKEGVIAGAALDVFVQEPLKESPLTSLPNVILTPHIGASTAEAEEKVSVDIAERMVAFFKGLGCKCAESR